MMRSITLIFCLILFAPLASAEIEILSVSGASNFDANLNNDNAEGTPIIYGGMAGNEANCDTTDGTNLCNNCSALTTSWEVCNESRIYDSLTITISFRSDADSGGRAYIRDNDDESLNQSTTPDLGSGATHTVTVLWSDICGGIEEGASTCEGLDDSAQFDISIENDGDSVDSTEITFIVANPDVSGSFTDAAETELCGDNDENSQGGICEFTAYPGDGKIYITDVGNDGAFPNEDGIQIASVRVFISDTGFDALTGPGATDGVLSPEDLEVTVNSDDSTDVDQTVDGLDNGTRYYFKVGVVDLAGNLTRVTSDTAITDTSTCGTLTPDDDTSCQFSATPSEVLGLLSEDFNCFVATAAYGSTMDERLNIFREFRSKVLKSYTWGRKLTAWYYRVGPYAAKWLAEHPQAKPFVRAFLWPSLGFAWVANSYGLLMAAAFSVLGFGCLFGMIFVGFRKLRQH